MYNFLEIWEIRHWSAIKVRAGFSNIPFKQFISLGDSTYCHCSSGS
uniref:Uncharacterized protein n=1 Tax=Arundo donax TaxID=35708 RepID=A0A0A9C970_ARUDO